MLFCAPRFCNHVVYFSKPSALGPGTTVSLSSATMARA